MFVSLLFYSTVTGQHCKRKEKLLEVGTGRKTLRRKKEKKRKSESAQFYVSKKYFFSICHQMLRLFFLSPELLKKINFHGFQDITHELKKKFETFQIVFKYLTGYKGMKIVKDILLI